MSIADPSDERMPMFVRASFPRSAANCSASKSGSSISSMILAWHRSNRTAGVSTAFQASARGGHYGQRSCEPHQKAEHMAAPTQACDVKTLLANSEPSTHDPKRSSVLR